MARGDTVEAVEALAAKYGVSVRTGWRWLAQMHAEQSQQLLSRKQRAGGECESCGKSLPNEATIRRRYCDGACRVRAHRRLRDKERLLAAKRRRAIAAAARETSGRPGGTPEREDLGTAAAVMAGSLIPRSRPPGRTR